MVILVKLGEFKVTYVYIFFHFQSLDSPKITTSVDSTSMMIDPTTPAMMIDPTTPVMMIDPIKPANMKEMDLETTENYILKSRTTRSTTTGNKEEQASKKEDGKSEKGYGNSKKGEKGSQGLTCDSLKNSHELAKVVTDNDHFSWYFKNCFPKYAGNLIG